MLSLCLKYELKILRNTSHDHQNQKPNLVFALNKNQMRLFRYKSLPVYVIPHETNDRYKKKRRIIENKVCLGFWQGKYVFLRRNYVFLRRNYCKHKQIALRGLNFHDCYPRKTCHNAFLGTKSTTESVVLHYSVKWAPLL